jgi:hypothetical protein
MIEAILLLIVFATAGAGYMVYRRLLRVEDAWDAMEGIVKGKIAADIDRLDTMIQDRTIDLGTETIQLFKDVEQIVDTIQELDAQTARLFKELEEQLQGAFHIVGNDIDSMGMAIHAVAMAKATSSDGLTPPPLPTLEN